MSKQPHDLPVQNLPESILENKKVILVAQHIGTNAGGEAMKSYQYAGYLKELGAKMFVVAHERSLTEMAADLDAHDYYLIRDNLVQRLLWRISILRFLLPVYFHYKARTLIEKTFEPDTDTVVHYIAPISPVIPRFPPRKFRVIVGPLSGGIYYPPAFWNRMSFSDRLRSSLHALAQKVLGRVFADKPQADRLLVSGYERTRASLKLAGATDDQMVDVVDSGINSAIFAMGRCEHAGRNAQFMASGRLVPVKALDLAIRAVAQAQPDVELSIYGNGLEMGALQSLTAELGLRDRIHFKGWTEQEALIEAFKDYRGYVFPSLADSNGIVMQEAMMAGVPVVALQWGGPAGLADKSSAIFVEPNSEEQVIRDFAQAMDRLASDPEFAEELSKNARAHAEANFPWEAVAGSWLKVY